VCNFYGFSCGVSGFVSIITITAMTVERYLVIKKPLNSLKITLKLTKSMLIVKFKNFKFQIIKNHIKKGSIFFIWCISAAWMLPEFFSKNGFVLEGFLTHCSFDYISRDHFTRTYMMIMFCGGFFFPLLIIIILNILIFKILKTKNEQFYTERIKISNKRLKKNDSLENNKIRKSIVCFCTKLKLNELKLIKTILLMVSLFCLS